MTQLEVGPGALGRRDALDELRSLRSARDDVERDIREKVRQAVDAGHTWEDVGAALGVTRQAVHARYGNLTDRDGPFSDLATVAGVGGWDDIRVLDAWRQSATGAPTGYPLGAGADGHILELRPEINGLLVVGSTGSGKSSMLRAVVLAAASRSSPAALNVVLLGGRGTASFGECLTLPHTVAALGPDPAERDVVALARRLTSELERRQARLRDLGTGERRDPALGDPGDPAPPRVLVVVDEVGALERDHPSLRLALDSAARYGRPLGVQVVAAGGRYDKQSATARLQGRLALRAHSAQESEAVIGSDAAARLSRTDFGHGWLRMGGRDLTELRVAYMSKSVERQAAAALRASANRQGDASPAPWLTPLPALLSLTQLAPGPDAPDGQPVAITIDGAGMQPWCWDASGSIAVVGSDEPDRRDVLQSLVLGLPQTPPAGSPLTARATVLAVLAGDDGRWDPAPHRRQGPVVSAGTPEEMAPRLVEAAAAVSSSLFCLVVDDVRAARRRLARSDRNAAAALDHLLARAGGGTVVAAGAASTGELTHEGCSVLLGHYIELGPGPRNVGQPGAGTPGRGLEQPHQREVQFATWRERARHGRQQGLAGGPHSGHDALRSAVAAARAELDEAMLLLQNRLQAETGDWTGGAGTALREALWRAEHARRGLAESLDVVVSQLEAVDRSYQAAVSAVSRGFQP